MPLRRPARGWKAPFPATVIVVAMLGSLSAPQVSHAQAQRGIVISAKQLEVMRTEKRVALVIGNSNYRSQPLRNPVNDARAMSRKLRSLGFDVIERTDVDKKRMQKSIIDFGQKLRDGGVGVFYFAGHGIQNRNRNFILPVDAQMTDESYLRAEGVNVNEVLSEMGDAGNRLNVLILDACRNNPYRQRTRGPRTGGLAQMHAPTGTYVSYAAAPGEMAFDGDGAHSPYTGALLDVIDRPGVKLEEAFKLVRANVHKATNGKQVPFTEDTVLGDFYFKVPTAGTAQRPSPAGAPGAAEKSAEIVFWSAIQNSKNSDVFEEFLKQFPNGQFAGLARIKLKELKGMETATAEPIPRVKAPGPVSPAIAPGTIFRDCEGARLARAGRAAPGAGVFCGPEMVVIPAGSFMMGSPASEPERDNDEGPQHRVTIGQAFAVGKFEVTQAEWRSVMGTDPSHFKGGRKPVESVSWDDAQAFVRRLGAKTGKPYRLLSEAEWEYAARAGTTTPFHTGATITTDQANYHGTYTYNGSRKGQYRGETVDVGAFAANAFGLHDLHGNVREWVGDCWNPSYAGAPTDGSVWSTGDCSLRILRGGSWVIFPRFMRAALRYWDTTGARVLNIGFRIARTLSRQRK